MFDFIFIVLVYRNTEDLKSFFSTFKVKNSKVVVVNSFYDFETDGLFRKIASENNADYLTVENKGYGYGNNRGCEYVLNKYKFKYLVISNPDVEILKWNYDILNNHNLDVLAPSIITPFGKYQNPSIVHKIRFVEYLKYISFAYNVKLLLLFAIFVTKIDRLLFLFINKKIYSKIYEPHGAFVLLSYDVVSSIYPVFNENMFLFCEEDHLASLLLEFNYNVYYTDSIKVLHKVDGSVKYLNSDLNKIISRSYLEYYKYWNMKK